MPSLSDLKKLLQPLQCRGLEAATFSRVIPFDADNAAVDVLMWAGRGKSELISGVKAGIILCEPLVNGPENEQVSLVVVPNARAAFRQVLETFFKKEVPAGIHPTAIIHPDAVLPGDCYVGAYAVIEAGCRMGKGVRIGHHSVISSSTIIEDEVLIGTHCSIGGDGFGYEKDAAGHYRQIPHIGYVHIKKGVDIGNQVCIDRGTLGPTTIGPYCRIDNLVHIAHNVQIGKDTLVIAQAMIAGSCEIGNNVWIAPCAAILNKIKIADNAIIGMGAVVLRDVQEGETVIGNPARVTKSS